MRFNIDVPQDRAYRFEIILDILESYWFEEPDELKVRVTMDFVHANGEKQSKQIIWTNPRYEYTGDVGDCIIPLSAINDEYLREKEAEFWSVSEWGQKLYTD